MVVASQPGPPARWLVNGVLLTGVLAVSTAAVLIRQCEAPSLAIAAWRLGLAATVLLALEVGRGRRPPAPADLAWCALAGAFLAVHFGAWISSLRFTTVASSVVLVAMSPLFVGFFTRWALKEALGPWTVAGLALATAGAVTVGWGDFGGGAAPLLGDGLALLGAAAAAAYLVTGRHVRRRIDAGTYAAWVYGSAAALLVVGALAAGQPLGPYPRETYGYLVLLALVPQLTGHTCFNWALAHLPATKVAVVILGEPVGATILAFLILGEFPGPATLVGGGVILAGIALALRGSGRGSPSPSRGRPGTR